MNGEKRDQSSGSGENGALLAKKNAEAIKSKSGIRIRLTTKGCVLAAILFLSWLLVFGAGILINSQPYRESISSWQGTILSWRFVAAALMVVLTWTPLNIALLAGTSGLLGAQARFAGLEEKEIERPDVTNPYFSALFRGFYIYLLFISGMLVIVETPFSSPTQEQYLRLAGLLSLVSFLVNYKLGTFAKFLRYSAERIEKRRKEEEDNPNIGQ
jgi:hypothetical protein